MLTTPFNTRTVAGFLLAISILLGLGIYSYFNTRSLFRSNDWVVHTLDVLYNTERVIGTVRDIEVGQRGYALTGNLRFLEPYTAARQEVDIHFKNLLELTKDNPGQQNRIRFLQDSVRKLLNFSAQAVRLRGVSADSARLLNATLKGKLLLDGVRRQIAEIQSEENRLLKRRIEESDVQARIFNSNIVVLLTATGLILAVVFYGIHLNLQAKNRTAQELQRTAMVVRDLYDNAPCGYHSLDANGMFTEINQTLLKWLMYSKDEVVGKLRFTDIITSEEKQVFEERFRVFKETGYVNDLEFCFRRKDGSEFPVILHSIAIYDERGRYLQSRTTSFDNTRWKTAETKIKNLNKELEAFSYSVSHDLRAPLRSINGYTKIIQEDYDHVLDAEGKRLLNVIIRNAGKMEKLIDELLQFSKVGRKEMVRTNVDMNKIIEDVRQGLVESAQAGTAEFVIQRLHVCTADPEMIRQVWENLISNAIKYSSRKEHPKIEITSELSESQITYAIKDNGAGFDMNYAEKLFQVFQRLHRAQDFDGVGVGLAIVHRIVSRHGGKVWAEGKVNEGASFYFTIPK